MNVHSRKFAAAPGGRTSDRARRRRGGDAVRVPVRHLVLPGHETARVEAQAGERIGAVLLRAGWAERRAIGRRKVWSFRLPTILVLNGEPVLQRHWLRRRLRAGDDVVFFSRPLGGIASAARSPTGKAVMGIVATIALVAFAPYLAQTAFFLAGGLGVAPAWMASAVMLGGALFIATLTQPRPGGQNDPAAPAGGSQVDQVYSAQAQGNAARLLQPIPVQYGRLQRLPDWAMQPWSEFVGSDQYLNILLSRGEGRYQVHQLLTDDTVIWDEDTGADPAFEDVAVAHHDPGDPVTLFPVNVVASVEVSGQTVPENPDWLGGFIANDAGTEANAIAVDLVFPMGLIEYDDEGRRLTHTGEVQIQGRRVDNAGAPIESYATLLQKTYQAKSRTPLRFTEKLTVAAGRWEIRVRRTDNADTGPKKYNDMVWQGLRSYIVGADNIFDISVTAIRIKATAFTSESARRFAVNQTRILPVWNVEDEEWEEIATRNPWWAFYDMATNAVYGARRPLSKLDFQTIVDEAVAAEAREDYFDYCFTGTVSLPDAFDTALRVARARHRWSGDILTAVRDEFRAVPRMLLTDREIIRDSVQISYALNSEDGADAVILEYVDEETWQPAEVQYPPDTGEFIAERPSRIQVPGIVTRVKAFEEAAFYWLSNLYRRQHVKLATERDGRALGFGATVRLQTELPASWGVSGAILFVDENVLTADRALIWAPSGQHYIAIRTKTGAQFGPVKCGQADPEDLSLIELDPTDLDLVETQSGMTLAEALDRADGADDPSFDFGVGDRRARNCLVMGGAPSGNRVNLALVVNDARCYPENVDEPPARPSGPSLQDQVAPQIAGLHARFGQGVAEPVLSASWQPAAGAFYYVAEVSYDEGEAWEPAYEGIAPSFAVPVDYAALRLRVQAVGVRRGAWASVDLEAPEIEVLPGTVSIDSLIAGLRDFVTRELVDTLSEYQRVLDRIGQILAEQGVRNQIEVQTSRQVLTLARDSLSASIEEVRTVALGVDSALAVFQLTVSATYATQASVAEVSESLTAFASGYESMAEYNLFVTSTFATSAALASVSSSFTAFTSGYASMAVYDLSVQAQFGSLSASVNVVAAAVADVEGYIGAVYGVTVTVDGYGSGFQLYNGGSTSSFTVTASTFQVAAPGETGGAPVPVFQVSTVNGDSRLVLRGDMYADGIIFGRSIVGAEITGSHIKADTIETTNIKSEAATALFSATGSDNTAITDNDVLVEVTCNIVNGQALVFFTGEPICEKTAPGGAADTSGYVTIDFYVDGVAKNKAVKFKSTNTYNGTAHRLKLRHPLTMMARISDIAPGTRTISAVLTAVNEFDSGSIDSRSILTPTIAVMESRR